jgi:5-methylcytosine-specific restriction endonuclease McrA
MRLKTLKPRLQAANLSRLQSLPTGAVERKRGSAGVRDRQRIKDRDCGLCQQCRLDGKVTLGDAVDHKVPLWAGGSDEDANKWLLCDPCHDAKTALEAAQRASGGLGMG